jgi:RNA polymerase sigma-70 factor (ECF subfamily)
MMWLIAAIVTGSSVSAEQDRGAALVGRLASGDRAAMAQLYDIYGKLLYSLAFRMLADEGDAEDVVQDVFTRVWSHASTFDNARGSVIAWLVTMTRTRAIDRLRARRTRPEATAVHDRAAIDGLPVSAAPIDMRLISEQEGLRLRQALEALPSLERIAIELAYFEGLSQSEIADRLEQPLGTVKTRMRRGLLRLRDAVGGATS